ncbi:hypothetical protein ACFSWE_01660 [Leucobacter albus]|uniref:Exosortase/archaeosortase family protein n=1 Tax=Leucobacter albus TaxID=272210 RepID=A0ABW3TP17_9MICO
MEPISTTATPAPRTAHTKLRGSGAQKLVAVFAVICAVALLATNEASRQLEAQLAGWAISTALGVGTEVPAGSTLISIGGGSQHYFTVDLSFACSVALIIAPLLLVAAGLLFTGRTTVFRAVPAVLVGAALLVAANAARFILIASMTRRDNLEGFGWAHSFYGSALVLGALLVVLVGFVYFITRGNRTSKHSASEHGR